MDDQEIKCISLTGENSHKLRIPLGQGSFSIGTKGISKGKYDAWVEKDSPINWDAFNTFFTGYGKKNADKYPYGDWPRFIYYSGDDQGFIEWSKKRHIEEFHWSPKENTVAYLESADILKMHIFAEKCKVEVLLGHKMQSLFLSGNLNNITVIKGSFVPYLNFSFFDMKSENKSYQLPVYSALKKATSVEIANEPIGQTFDCNSLLQFQDVTSLSLIGNMINLEALKELKHLERIGLHFLRDLSNMPSLKSWVNLKSFIGNNIEETEGKIIKSELNKIMKVRELDYSSVSKLRKKIWFTTEYEIPFSNWEKKNEKIAVKAYKVCLKEVKKAGTEQEVKNAIFGFIEGINQLYNIETSEREDVGIAVNQLIEASAVEIPQQTGEMWIDEMRDF